MTLTIVGVVVVAAVVAAAAPGAAAWVCPPTTGALIIGAPRVCAIRLATLGSSVRAGFVAAGPFELCAFGSVFWVWP